MEAPDFWDDAEVSQMKMKELKSMKDDMETYHNLVTQMEDMETMIEMGYEENDPDLIPEIQEMLDQFQADFDNIRIKTLLSGEYDNENAIIKLNAGAGGTIKLSQEVLEEKTAFPCSYFFTINGFGACDEKPRATVPNRAVGRLG